MKIKKLFIAIACLIGMAAAISSCSKDDDKPAVKNAVFSSNLSIGINKPATIDQVANSIKDYLSKELGADAKVTLTKGDASYSMSIESLNGADLVTDKLQQIQDNPSALNSVIDGINGATSVILTFSNNGTTVFEYKYKSCYSIVGIWRHTDSEGKFGTLYVQAQQEGENNKAAFTYDGKGYEGKVRFLNSTFRFTSDDSKLIINGDFANKDNNKITCTVTYDKVEVGTDLTFERREKFNTVTYEEFYTVEDPDNELPALGIDLNNLKTQAAAVTFKSQVTNGRIDTNFGMMLTVMLHTIARADSIANDHNNQFPALVNSKAYVKSDIKVTYDDMKYDLTTFKTHYNIDLRRKD